ncbi:MAG TPA: GNAT family N-acetyltransferase, partial [Pyrinomonadaceae bacterium]|nr:GNAT family N-acetyltransferase [Pyrinomonadaceae bacterium]
PADEEFLFQLYASTRTEELAPLGWSAAQLTLFLRLQFEAQRRHYNAHFSPDRHHIILLDGQPVGRMWVELRADEIRAVDIALLPSVRGSGIGTQMLHELIAESIQTGLPLRFSVEKNNLRALPLYERLGFVVIGDIGTHFLMEHKQGTG